MSTNDDEQLSRRETTHLRHPHAVWTSFDRYSRYAALAGVVRLSLGPGRHRVLDVGDASGYLRVFDRDLDVVSVDVAAYGEPLPGTVRVLGDGAHLPFPDDTFDAVISSDALEHVAPEQRAAFLREGARVSRDLVAIAAPFDTPGVGGAEDLVRRFALLTTGRPQEQLEEHRDYGLPGLEQTEATLRDCGLQVAARGNGNLHDWASMMMLKHQLMPRHALEPLSAGYDLAYNFLFTGRNAVPPFYRHVVAGRRSEAAVWPAPDGGDTPDAQPLLTSFLAANISEVVRQDVVPKLDEQLMAMRAFQANTQQGLETVLARVDEQVTSMTAMLSAQADARHEQSLATALARDALVNESLTHLENVVGALHARLDTLSRVVRHPLSVLRRS